MSTYQKACKDLGFKPRSEAAMAEMAIYVHGAFSGNVLAKGGEGLDPNKPKEEKVYGGTLSARGRGLHGADWDNTQGDHHVLGYDKNHETKKQIQALRAKVQLEHEKRLTTASELRDRRALEAKRSKRAPAVPGMISRALPGVAATVVGGRAWCDVTLSTERPRMCGPSSRT